MRYSHDNSDVKRVLSLLGLARRSGALLIGQDVVLNGLKARCVLLVLLVEDCARNVVEKLNFNEEHGKCSVICLKGICREKLGEAVGIRQTQVVALSASSGFARRIKGLLLEGGEVFEQDQSV